jgi:hypothetical protein
VQNVDAVHQAHLGEKRIIHTISTNVHTISHQTHLGERRLQTARGTQKRKRARARGDVGCMGEREGTERKRKRWKRERARENIKGKKSVEERERQRAREIAHRQRGQATGGGCHLLITYYFGVKPK